MDKTTKKFRCRCSGCGEVHEGSPSLAFDAPHGWTEELRTADPQANRKDSDLCVIGGDTFFIRCVLEIPIIGYDQPFTWGIWLSQSEENFRSYVATFYDAPDHMAFGYFANALPGYPSTLSLHTQAHWRSNGLRPWVELFASDHLLYENYVQGISWDRAMELARLRYRH